MWLCLIDIEKRNAGFAKIKVVKKLDTDTVNKFVKKNVEPGSKIQTDDLDIIYDFLADIEEIEHGEYPIVSGEKPAGSPEEASSGDTGLYVRFQCSV